MSDTKYNFDDYIFDNVLEDTYLAIKDVRENIDRWVKETREEADGHIDSARVYSQAVAPRLIDYFQDCAQYLKEKTADMSLSDKTQETIDSVCANFEWNETKRIEARFADVVEQEGRKHIDVSEAENDGQEMEFQHD